MNKRIAKKQAKQQLANQKNDPLATIRRYERILLRRGTIGGNLKKGEHSITYDAYKTAGELALFTVTKELITPVTRSGAMVDLLVRNNEKLKHKLSHTVRVRGTDHMGKSITICMYQLHGHHSIRDAVRQAIELFPKNVMQQGSGKRGIIKESITRQTRGSAPLWTAGEVWTPKEILITTTIRN